MRSHAAWSRLPLELIAEILAFACAGSPKTSLALSKMSHWTNEIGTPYLFETVALDRWKGVYDLITAASSLRFTSTLHLLLDSSSIHTHPNPRDDLYVDLRRLLGLCTKLKHLTISIAAINGLFFADGPGLQFPDSLRIYAESGYRSMAHDCVDALRLLHGVDQPAPLQNVTRFEIALLPVDMRISRWLEYFPSITHTPSTERNVDLTWEESRHGNL
jgi:hypothetical protein